MNNLNLEIYWKRVIEGMSAEAKQIPPSSVITAPWVRLKCQYGCPSYDRGYCCPPETPTPEQTRKVLDSYNRSILFHFTTAKKPGQARGKLVRGFMEALVDLEGEMFKDGLYRAFVLLSGPCSLCEECGKLKGVPCRYGSRARPSMESVGIDVYRTAWNSGFPIAPLKEKKETQNLYCLMLAD
jgi:predicted metal-binding protein